MASDRTVDAVTAVSGAQDNGAEQIDLALAHRQNPFAYK